MAKPPHPDDPTIDVAKLRDYCLSATHPRGRHKARVFQTALGLMQTDAEWLKTAIAAEIGNAEAIEMETDTFGTRWRADLKLVRQARSAVVRTLWIVRPGEATLRFVTCWVL